MSYISVRGEQSTSTEITALTNLAALPTDATKAIVKTGSATFDQISVGSGTVTSVSVVTANGVSGSVANATTTPAITLTLGAITPTTVNGLTISSTTGTLTLANGSTLVTSGANSITLTSSGATNVTLPTTGTLATLAGTEELDNKTLDSSVGKGTWTASGTWTIPAVTLNGTVSGGGNQLNNIIIGTSTPLAGSFTTLLATTSVTTGAAGGTTGSVIFKGTTSGTVTVKVADAAGTYTLTLPTNDGGANEYLQTDGNGVLTWASAGTGDVTSSSNITDNAIVRGDGGAKGVQQSGIIIDDSNNVSSMGTLGVGAVTSTGLLTVSLAGNAARFVNSTDNASVQVAKFEGDRATMADGDEGYVSLLLSDDGGTQTEFGRLSWVATDVNDATSEDGRLDFAVITAGTLADEIQLTGTALSPSADGGSSLGTTALGWQNLFGNTGFVVNIENGDWVATHTAGILTVGTGDLRVTTAGTNTASAVTVGGTQTLTNKTLTSPVIGTSPTAAGATWTDLGTVTTADINGGTLDGAVIGGASAAAITGTVITANTSVLPDADGGAALGAANNGFSILGLASGSTINFANSNVVVTHSSGILTMGTGEMRITTVGTNSASVVTIGGTQTLTNKTLTSPTLTTPSAFTTGGTITLAENTSIALDPAGSADGKYSGITIAGTAGATLAFGDLIYLAVADSRWELTDADAAATAGTPLIGICVLAAANDGDSTTILLYGTIRADAAFPALTVGAPVYVGETAGDIQVAIPTGADNVIRVVGRALTADEILFNPSQDHQVTVA